MICTASTNVCSKKTVLKTVLEQAHILRFEIAVLIENAKVLDICG